VDSVPASGGTTRAPETQDLAPKITRAARTLFARKGFDATTTQEIAAKADIGTGTPVQLREDPKKISSCSLFFAKKKMDVVVERAFATIPFKGSLLDQLLHVFDAFVAYHQTRRGNCAHASHQTTLRR